MSKFQSWILKQGLSNIARQLNKSHQVVSYWLHLRVAPRPETAKKIIELSGGYLGWGDIYEPFCERVGLTQLEFDFSPDQPTEPN